VLEKMEEAIIISTPPKIVDEFHRTCFKKNRNYLILKG
jgi:hypothetical protein